MEKAGFFHHPDFSLPVIRRRIGDELVDFLFWFGKTCATRGRSLTWTQWGGTRTAYDSAVYRLRKAGLVVSREITRGRTVLDVTEAARKRKDPASRPHRLWNRKWKGYWYVLVYDVPEKERSYRNVIRGFLVRMRMGCLQRSVYVAPDDIRPEYHDLTRAAELGRYAFLFESRTVLGRSPEDIVCAAWDFDRLSDAQDSYCRACRRSLGRLGGNTSKEQLVTLAREEIGAYRAVMAGDPFLPRELWPPNYRGEAAYRAHLEFVQTLGERL